MGVGGRREGGGRRWEGEVRRWEVGGGRGGGRREGGRWVAVPNRTHRQAHPRNIPQPTPTVPNRTVTPMILASHLARTSPHCRALNLEFGTGFSEKDARMFMIGILLSGSFLQAVRCALACCRSPLCSANMDTPDRQKNLETTTCYRLQP